MRGEPAGQALVLHDEAQPITLGVAVQRNSHEHDAQREASDEEAIHSAFPVERH